MGGDNGAQVVLPAAKNALNKHDNLHLILVGKEEVIHAGIKRYNIDAKRVTVQHASEEVAMDERPSLALRNKKDSSMRVAINCVKEGLADACVSAGNTGALMATAKFVLKTLPGVDRPAIISALPTTDPDKFVYMLDLGANIDATPEQLFQFAVMGSVVAESVENIENPTIGLLNIGEEEIKGNLQVKETAELLSQVKEINYFGYVEGDDIFRGKVDVVVCDGFVGNIALKTSEGLAKMLLGQIRQAFFANTFSKICAFFAMPVLRRIKHELDPARYNGASFIGLQGTVIKSHGGTNVRGFGHAIDEAIIEVERDVPSKIRHKVSLLLEEII
mgnify:CR=1 FL=1|tara:strand:- start:172463 stop:173458 length:996 start_codon:yes stop_codon:yes gene_type:complete